MKLTKKILFILAFSLVFSSILISSSVYGRADDDIDTDPDGIDPETKKNAERIVTIENNGNSAKLTSILKYSEDKDDFSIDISANNELSFKGLYKSHTETNHINLEFQLRLYSIVEYLDTDENGVYDADVDTYVGEYDIDEFSPIVYTNGDAHILVIETIDGVFLARVFAVEGISDINGVIVTPMEVKIDFEIHNYDFIESESRLALLVHFQTNAAYGWNEKTHAEEAGYESEETEVEMKNRDATGYFSWANHAVADGQDVEVLGSPLKNSPNGKKIYLNYPHATDIIHDPKIGFVGDFSTIGIYLIIGGVAVAAIIGAVFFIKKRR
jgi:hypothetical protein